MTGTTVATSDSATKADHLICNVPQCVGRSKEKAGIQLECIPEKRIQIKMNPWKISPLN